MTPPMRSDGTAARLGLVAARERLRAARRVGYGAREALAGDVSGNVAIAGTTLVLARVAATGRPIVAHHPTGRTLGVGEALNLPPMGEEAPAGWYVPGMAETPRVCGLYSGVALAQHMVSPTFPMGAFPEPNGVLEFAQAFSFEWPFFGLRVLNGDAYVLDLYSGFIVRFDAGGSATPVVLVSGHPRLARTFSSGDLIPMNPTAPWTNAMQFDVAANGRVYFDRLSGTPGLVAGEFTDHTSTIMSCDLEGHDEQMIATTGAQVWSRVGYGAVFVAYSAYDDAVYWGWNEVDSTSLLIYRLRDGVVSLVGGAAGGFGPSVGESIAGRRLIGGRVFVDSAPAYTTPFTMAACDPLTGRLYWASWVDTGPRTIHCIDRDGVYQQTGLVSHAHSGNVAGSLAIGRGCNRPTMATVSRRGPGPTDPYFEAIIRSGVDLDSGETGVNEPIVAARPRAAALGLPDAMVLTEDRYYPYFHAMDANGASETLYCYNSGPASDDAALYGAPSDRIGKTLLVVT